MPAEPTKIVKLYGGEVTVKYFENPYPKFLVTDPVAGIVDKRLRGVTTYLGIKDKSMGLVPWATRAAGLFLIDKIKAGQPLTEEDVICAVNIHKTLKDDAATTGKDTHAWCQSFIEYKLGRKQEKPLLPADKAVMLGVNSFLEFVIQHHVEFIDTELIVYHREEQYIGFMDALAKVDGVLSVIDLKTSNGLYNNVLAQMSAYAVAYEREHLGVDPDPAKAIMNRWALRLAKESEAEYTLRKERECYIDGKSVNTIKGYLPFEFVQCPGLETLRRDFEAFLWMRNTFVWDDATDFYKNPPEQPEVKTTLPTPEAELESIKTEPVTETQPEKRRRYHALIETCQSLEALDLVAKDVTFDTTLSKATAGVLDGLLKAKKSSIVASV